MTHIHRETEDPWERVLCLAGSRDREQTMKGRLIIAMLLSLSLSAAAAEIKVASIDPAQVRPSGSHCTFDRKSRETVLVSDWAGKFWMMVDGRIIELTSQNRVADIERQLLRKRWRETLRAADLSIELDFLETGRGYDTVAFKGEIKLKRRGSTTRIPVSGGCSA